ncbi:MAG: site-specific integrase [Bacteroidetes bacterium]|nr:site-specific integrase [Bacteroidota bacterium]
MTTKVKLRQKKISGDRQSLYLDFYPAIPHPKTGEPTRREFLKLYLFDKAKSPIDKQHNKETLQIAEAMRQKKENQLNKPEIYTDFEKGQLKIREQGERNFLEYFKALANKRKASNFDNWASAYKYLLAYTNGSLRFSDLNEKFCNGFRDYLLTTKSNKSIKTKLAQNSAVSYFNKFKATLKQAYKDGYLGYDLNSKIEQIKSAETRRNYLTIEELNKLNKTECQNPLLKRAAIFSAMTGLRFSDIQKMEWDEIEYVNGQGYIIHFKQQKTKGIEELPISEQAFGLLGERPDTGGKVFEGLEYSAYQNKHLYQWIGAAGITKDITFHCFRHTFATLQLSNGTDIYTVSKMLGHRELKTTQLYAKIIDKSKRDAANKITLDL